MRIDKVFVEALMFRPALPPTPTAWSGHIPFAHWLVNQLKPKCFVELGVHWGHSFFGICEAIKSNNIDCKCHAIDCWQGDQHAGEYGSEVYDAFCAFNEARYADMTMIHRMSFDEAVHQFADGSIDLLHIDGLHTYEAVKHDYETWLPKMAPGSIIMFHDTQERKDDFGVCILWEELTTDNHQSFEFLHGHGLGILGIGFQCSKDFPGERLDNTMKVLLAITGEQYALIVNQKNKLLKLDQTVTAYREIVKSLVEII